MARREPDVQVHITKGGGCPLCRSTSRHTHSQVQWRALLDGMTARGKRPCDVCGEAGGWWTADARDVSGRRWRECRHR